MLAEKGLSVTLVERRTRRQAGGHWVNDVADQFDAKRVEESVQGMLAGGVARAPGNAGLTCQAGNADDAAPAFLQEVQGMPGAINTAELVHPHEPFQQVSVLDFVQPRPHGDPGIVDEGVDPTELPAGALDQVLALFCAKDAIRDLCEGT